MNTCMDIGELGEAIAIVGAEFSFEGLWLRIWAAGYEFPSWIWTGTEFCLGVMT